MVFFLPNSIVTCPSGVSQNCENTNPSSPDNGEFKSLHEREQIPSFTFGSSGILKLLSKRKSKNLYLGILLLNGIQQKKGKATFNKLLSPENSNKKDIIKPNQDIRTIPKFSNDTLYILFL